MKGANYDTTHYPEAPRFCVVEGRSAKIFRLPAAANPYPRHSPEWRCWRHGHGLPITNVSRVTVPRDVRGDLWSDSEIWFLRWAGDSMNAADMAAILKRSHQAVRSKLHRMRQNGGG